MARKAAPATPIQGDFFLNFFFVYQVRPPRPRRRRGFLFFQEGGDYNHIPSVFPPEPTDTGISRPQHRRRAVQDRAHFLKKENGFEDCRVMGEGGGKGKRGENRTEVLRIICWMLLEVDGDRCLVLRC
jgi:hypothetical protein